MTAPPVFRSIGIVGLGLIGGSLAMAVRERWPEARIIGIDRRDVLDAALRLGIVDAAADGLGALADTELVVLAAPVKQNVALLDQLARHMPRPAIITDAGSTKRDIVEAASCLPDRLTFIGGHPLGGAAAAGLNHARADLFVDRPWLLTPTPGQQQSEALQTLTAFVRALGSTPQSIDAATHDRLLGFLSHLPQLTASTLMAVVGDAVGLHGLTLAGRGLTDTTRLASSPPAIWCDIAASNADQLGPALDMLIGRLQDLRDDLTDGQRLRETFDRAVYWRQQLPKLN